MSKFPSRVYVPNSDSNTVSVINPSTYKVIDQFPVGAQSTARRPLLRPEDALGQQRPGQQPDRDRSRTGKPGRTVPVTDPYNLYFTPDGQLRDRRGGAHAGPRLSRRPHDAAPPHAPVPCAGVNHMDFTADGRYLVASCEFGGKPDQGRRRREKVVGTLAAPLRSEPAGREALAGRPHLLRRGLHERGLDDRRPERSDGSASFRPASGRTASTRAATLATSTSRIATRARSR